MSIIEELIENLVHMIDDPTNRLWIELELEQIGVSLDFDLDNYSGPY